MFLLCFAAATKIFSGMSSSGKSDEKFSSGVDKILEKLEQVQTDLTDLGTRVRSLEKEKGDTSLGTASGVDHADVDRRLSDITTRDFTRLISRVSDQTSAANPAASAQLPSSATGVSADSLLRHCAGFSAIQADQLQAEFRVVQDSYSKVRLPADLKFNSDRQGIKSEARATANIIGSAARHAETGLKDDDSESHCLLNLMIRGVSDSDAHFVYQVYGEFPSFGHFLDPSPVAD